MRIKGLALVVSFLSVTLGVMAQSPGSLKWNFSSEKVLLSPPSIGLDGTIYVGTGEDRGMNYLYAIGMDGSIKWQYEVSGEIDEPPAIGSDGRIYASVSTPYLSQTDKKLIVLDINGNLQWYYRTPITSPTAPAIDVNGNVYFCSYDTLYALDSNGQEKWKFKLPGHSRSPILGPDGTLYVCARNSLSYSATYRRIYAIDTNGNEKWHFERQDEIVGWPAIGPNGAIYVCFKGQYDYNRANHKLYALNPDGTEKWSYGSDNRIYTGPSVGSDGGVYFCDYYGILTAIDSTGAKKWTLDKEFGTVPAIGSDQVIYVGAGGQTINGKFWAIGPDGTVKWESKFGSERYSDPAIGRDGAIYVLNYQKSYGLCAISCEAFGLSQSSWPKTRGGNMYRGRADDPPPAKDIGITSITTDSIVSINNPQIVKAILCNMGSESQSGFPVAYQVDDSAPVVEIVHESIQPNQTMEYSFQAPWVPNRIDSFSLTIITGLAGDQVSANDTSRTVVQAAYQMDVGVSEIPIPSSVGKNRAVAIKVGLNNAGIEDQSGFPVSYRIDSGPWITENHSDTLAARSSEVFIFSETWMPTELGFYRITIKIDLDGDQDTSNDQRERDVSVVDAAYMGTWEGTTSQNRSIFFKVNGQDQIDSISAAMRVNFGPVSCVYTFSSSNLISIENDTFSVEIFGGIFVPSGSSNPIVHGVFSDAETCAGTIGSYKAAGGYCGGLVIGTGYSNSSQTWTVSRTGWTRVAEEALEPIVLTYRLTQNYPNPFNPLTTIEYKLPKRSHVLLTIIDIRGRDVMSLVDGEQDTGQYRVQVDADGLPSGTYFYKLTTDDQVLCRKMTIVK